MRKMFNYIFILVLWAFSLKCETHKRHILEKKCENRRVDSLFNYCFHEYAQVLEGKVDLSSLSKEASIVPYFLILYNEEGKASIDWAGSVHFDSTALVEWEKWYHNNKCTISWSDVKYALNIYGNITPELDIDDEIAIIDSLFMH